MYRSGSYVHVVLQFKKMPRALSTGEQSSNIFLVQEVEKYPCLYNYKIKDYTRRDITDAAWEKIATAVHDTGK